LAVAFDLSSRGVALVGTLPRSLPSLMLPATFLPASIDVDSVVLGRRTPPLQASASLMLPSMLDRTRS